MTLFNSTNPRIAAAQGDVIDTLMNIPDEYGAVFVIADLQDMKGGELAVAVREHTRRKAIEEKALMLNRPGRRGRRKPAQVIDFATRERIAS